jgi:exodeoxyribonuclease VII small subunit
MAGTKRQLEKTAGSTLSFEQAMDRLDKIVSEMEGGSLSLEDMIARFEEGQGLLQTCGAKLNEVEKRIEVLVKKGEQVSCVPLVADEDVAGNLDRERDGVLPL